MSVQDFQRIAPDFKSAVRTAAPLVAGVSAAALAVLLLAAAVGLIDARGFGLGLAMAFFAAITAAAAVEVKARRRLADKLAVRDRQNNQAETGIGWTDIVDALTDPVLVLDQQARIVHHNEAARTLFAKPLAGLPLEYVSREPELIEAVEGTLATGVEHGARLTARLDVERHLKAAAIPLGASSGGGASAVLVSIQDISEQQKLLEMRSDFIANASHELRTPLASVRGFIETLQGPARNDEAARTRFLGIMSSQAERMTRLIDDLLLLSRVEEKAFLAPTGIVDINQTVNHVVATLIPLAAEKNIAIDFKPAAPTVSVTGDRDELVQVFQNLIENAVKYGSYGGHVWITVETAVRGASATKRVAIKVTDDGPGIASAHLPRLTERFYRVNADQSRTVGGTGLGLAIVKHVVSRHQGDLEVASTVGEGSTFTVTIPTRV